MPLANGLNAASVQSIVIEVAMSFTVAALHKALGKMIVDGHGRKPVWVNKDSFHHNCEDDGCVVLPVEGLGIIAVPMIDDDGGTKYDSKGREVHKTVCVLAGNAGSCADGKLLSESR